MWIDRFDMIDRYVDRQIDMWKDRQTDNNRQIDKFTQISYELIHTCVNRYDLQIHIHSYIIFDMVTKLLHLQNRLLSIDQPSDVSTELLVRTNKAFAIGSIK